jgi:hypothetical protein
MEWGDKEGRMVVEGVVAEDGEKEILMNVLLLWTSDLLATFINDTILMRVVSNSSGAGQGSEEVRKELGFWGKREWEVGKDGSGWGRGGNDGNRGFNDRWREVFY